MDEPIEIPEFDLAEEIMAEQRKVAATRRKGPGRKTNAVKRETPEPLRPDPGLQTPDAGWAGSSSHGVPCALSPSTQSRIFDLVSCEAEQVIAEIVARDIRRLCGVNISGVRQ